MSAAESKAESINVKRLSADVLSVAGATLSQGAAVADIAATTNIPAVPESFANEAAIQSYLAGANVVPNIEARLDGLEAKVNAILAALRSSGVIGA